MNDYYKLGEVPIGSGVFFSGLGYYRVYAKYGDMVVLKPDEQKGEVKPMNNQSPCAQCPDMAKGCIKKDSCADWYGWFTDEWERIQKTAGEVALHDHDGDDCRL